MRTTDTHRPGPKQGSGLLRGPGLLREPGLLRGHLKALDGLRGLAVLAVLAYHAGLRWAPGGLLGVDVFFVLSGFLITSLLVSEWNRTGTIGLGSFWGRRARRLLPALFVLLAGVAAYAWFVAGSDELHRIRLDALSSLGYVANWRFVASSQGYFAHTGVQSPLLHTWSLAVEEQFYVIWPIVSVLVLRRFGVRALGRLAGWGALASAGLMAFLYHSGASSSRLYYGTDTRAQALLVGAFLAVAGSKLADRPRAVGRGDTWPWVFPALGVAGMGLLAWAWTQVGGESPLLYQGGFLLVALATAAVILASALQPRGVLARALSWGPLAYVGRISYGLYLYHWPLFLWLDHARTGLSGNELLLARLGATAAISVASFHLLESPIRARRWFGALTERLSLSSALVLVAGIVVAATAAPSLASAMPSGPLHSSGAQVPALALAHPVNVMVLGDSVGLTLSLGLSVNDHARGVAIDGKAVLGCDFDPATQVKWDGHVTQANSQCKHWPSTWAGLVRADNPDVVLLVMGRWETYDRLYNGRWTDITQADFAAHLTDELRQAVGILSAQGAVVGLATLPYMSPPERADGGIWPENLASRVDAYNRIVRNVARAMPVKARVIDVNAILCPEGHFTSAINGVAVRWSDGIHVLIPGGELVGDRILPQLARLGLAHDQARLHQLSLSASTASRHG